MIRETDHEGYLVPACDRLAQELEAILAALDTDAEDAAAEHEANQHSPIYGPAEAWPAWADAYRWELGPEPDGPDYEVEDPPLGPLPDLVAPSEHAGEDERPFEPDEDDRRWLADQGRDEPTDRDVIEAHAWCVIVDALEAAHRD